MQKAPFLHKLFRSQAALYKQKSKLAIKIVGTAVSFLQQTFSSCE
jgi:hypothetical protein